MKKVAVLMGGSSKEREVSLTSGRTCRDALRANGLEVITIDVDRHIAERLLAAEPDVCFNALHGPLGEDGSIQGLLNILAIPYTHSGVLASALAMDKCRAKTMAATIGITVPDGGLVSREQFFASPPKGPFVLKPWNEGSSMDTFILDDVRALPFDASSWPYKGSALLEERIFGRELTVTVLNDRPLTVTEIRPAAIFFDYHSKYARGGSQHILPANLPPDVFDECLDNALRTHQAFGCRGVSRSDFILCARRRRPVFLELNTQPGLTPTSLTPEQATFAGFSVPDLMRVLVDAAATD